MSVEITPASLDQVIRGRGGNLMSIDSDVGNVAIDLQKIDSNLKLKYNEHGGFFAVIREHEDGSTDLVTTALELDQRIVERVRKVCDPTYDFNADVQRMENEGKKETEDAFAERVGDASERLAHAIRTDIRKARPGNTYIPPDISPSPNKVFLTKHYKKED